MENRCCTSHTGSLVGPVHACWTCDVDTHLCGESSNHVPHTVHRHGNIDLWTPLTCRSHMWAYGNFWSHSGHLYCHPVPCTHSSWWFCTWELLATRHQAGCFWVDSLLFATVVLFHLCQLCLLPAPFARVTSCPTCIIISTVFLFFSCSLQVLSNVC